MIGLQYRRAARGINLNAVIAAENGQSGGAGGAGLASKNATIGRFQKTPHTLSHAVLVSFGRGWMCTCSLMHGRGHVLEAPP